MEDAGAGLGWSSPVVAGGRVWLTTAVNDRGGSLRVLAFDVETGRQIVDVEVFRARSADPLNAKNSHASPTPIVDGDRVYVHFGADGTAALDRDRRDRLEDAASATSRSTATADRRCCIGDLLIVSCDGSDDGVRRGARQADRQGALEDRSAGSRGTRRTRRRW